MEFFSRAPRPQDAATDSTAAVIAMALGEFLARHHAEERYRELVDLSPDAIIVHCDGVIVSANQSAAALLGARSAARLAGQHIFPFVHPAWRDQARERVQGMYANRADAPRTEMKVLGADKTLGILAPEMVDPQRFNSGIDVVRNDQVDEYNAFLDSLGIGG